MIINRPHPVSRQQTTNHPRSPTAGTVKQAVVMKGNGRNKAGKNAVDSRRCGGYQHNPSCQQAVSSPRFPQVIKPLSFREHTPRFPISNPRCNEGSVRLPPGFRCSKTGRFLPWAQAETPVPLSFGTPPAYSSLSPAGKTKAMIRKSITEVIKAP